MLIAWILGSPDRLSIRLAKLSTCLIVSRENLRPALRFRPRRVCFRPRIAAPPRPKAQGGPGKSARKVASQLETFCHRASCAKGLLNTGEVLASVRDLRRWCAAALT